MNILNMVYNEKAGVVAFLEQDNKGAKREQKRKVVNGTFKWNNETWSVDSWEECLEDECLEFKRI